MPWSGPGAPSLRQANLLQRHACADRGCGRPPHRAHLCRGLLGLSLALTLLGGCAAPWRRAQPSKSPTSSATLPASLGAAEAQIWLRATPRTTASITAHLIQVAASHPTEVGALVDALASRCPQSVPAAAAALAAEAPLTRSNNGADEALGQVLLRCPTPTGAEAPAVSADLQAYLRWPLAESFGRFLPEAIHQDMPAADLQATLPHLTGNGAALAMQALQDSPAALLTDIVAHQNDPSGITLADGAAMVPDTTVEQWLGDPRLTDRAVRLDLLRHLYTQPDATATAWLRQAAPSEKDPAVAEMLWSNLYLRDQDPAALSALNHLVDAHGTFRIDPTLNVWDWHVLRPAAEADPGGFLARGIAAYEAVEGGRPYFVVDRCPHTYCGGGPYGNRQFDPAREIPGWQAFLRQYAGHPAAADAAYRLARCEEILGRWPAALHDMRLAADVYPDGQITSQAEGRLLFMLDVEIPYVALQSLAKNPPDPELAPAIRYSLAVRELRRGDYTQAAKDLAQHTPPAPALVPWRGWPTSGLAQQQEAEAAQMAALAGRAFTAPWSPIPPGAPRADFAKPPVIADPQAAYALAQILFHHDLALYNEMWGGSQQAFFAFDGAVNGLVDGDLSPQWWRQLRAMNNYVEAQPIFAAVAADPAAAPSLRAQAAYSAAECLVHLDGFNAATDATTQTSALRAQIVEAFRTFAIQYPKSGTLSTGALLTVASYTQAPADIAAVQKAAPGAWPAAADQVTAGRPLPNLGFQEVAATAPGGGSQSSVGADGWTTIRLAPADLPTGDGVRIWRIDDLAPGRARVEWGSVRPADQPRLPWARYGRAETVRVPAALTQVTFQGLK